MTTKTSTDFTPMTVTADQFWSFNALTNDPIDTMRLIADVYAFSAFLAEWHAAKASSSALPKAPPLNSRFLRDLVHTVANSLEDVAKLAAQSAREYLVENDVVSS
jgi:hypothetical protein